MPTPSLKIATWNVERPTQHSKKNEAVISILKNIDADIFILTETNEAINLGSEYSFHTSLQLPTEKLVNNIQYKTGENRTTIFTKNKIVKTYSTKNDFTNVCAEIETVFGNLIVYGTIIGIQGFIKLFFKDDLNNTIMDTEQLASENNFCLAGDFNCSFPEHKNNDFKYFKTEARTKLNSLFETKNLTNITAVESEIDHIALSNSFLENKKWSVEIWNEEKEKRKEGKLSDHLGVCVTITEQQ